MWRFLLPGSVWGERTKKEAGAKPGGKRRQVGKRVNFEPDSAFRGEKKGKAKAKPASAEKGAAKKAKKPSTKTQKIAAATKAKRAAKKKAAE